MALTGSPFLAVLVATAAALVGTTMLLWNHWPGRLAVPMRLLCLLLLMAAGAVLAADVVNRAYGFYSSFDDLLGRGPGSGDTAAGPADAGPRVVDGPRHGGGRVVQVRLAGMRSGVSRDALVYLPAAYFKPAGARRRFPVIELFHGYPGHPTNWTRQLHLQRMLDAEIGAGFMPPVIAVAPNDDDPGRDSECVNAVRGLQDETYLAVDVPADVQRDFRVLGGPRAWAAIGYSTGGFCAVNIALHHPDCYAGAVSLSGYYTAVVDGDTGDLYRRHRQVRQWNSPQWLVAHHRVAVPIYLVASRGDPEGIRNMQNMRQADGRVPVVTVTLPSGGHNFGVWLAASPAAFEWLGAHLPMR